MTQRDEQFLRTAPLDQVRHAYAHGELDDLLESVPDGQVPPRALPDMGPEEIAEAFASGKLTHALGGPAGRGTPRPA